MTQAKPNAACVAGHGRGLQSSSCTSKAELSGRLSVGTELMGLRHSDVWESVWRLASG